MWELALVFMSCPSFRSLSGVRTPGQRKRWVLSLGRPESLGNHKQMLAQSLGNHKQMLVQSVSCIPAEGSASVDLLQRDLPPLIGSVNRDCSLLPAQHSDTSGDPHSGFQLSLAGTFQYPYCSYWHRQQPGSEWKNYRSSSFSQKRMLGSWSTQLGRKREMGLLRNVRGSGALPQL